MRRDVTFSDTHDRRRGAFTLIEFMVAIGLLSILMVGVTSSFTFQQRTYVVVDQVAEAKQNVRVVADLIERELRSSGYMVPNTAVVCGLDDDEGPDKLYISNAQSIVAMGSLPSTLLTTPLGAVIENAPTSGLSAGDQTISLDVLDLDGIGGGDFAEDSGVIIADRNAATTAVACGRVAGVATVAFGAIPVQVELENDTGGLSSGSELVAIPAIIYELDGDVLTRNGVPIVDQVEDFQVAWFYDLNDDGEVDPGEYVADGNGVNDDYDPETLDNSLLREVRITVVVRTRDEDPNPSWRGGIGQALENRDPDSVAAQDGARRRVHTSTIRLRNNA